MKDRNILSGIILLLICTVAQATQIVLNASDTGWYDSTGFHDSGNKNTHAGMPSGPGSSISERNYMVFDLTSIFEVITSASVTMYNDPENDTGITFYLGTVTTPISTLEASQFGAIGIYNDLAANTVLASITTVSGYNTFTVLPIALSYLQAAEGSFFAIGGHSLNDSGHSFGFNAGIETDPTYYQLTINYSPVPEPATLALFSLGLAGMAFGKRRKQV
jgi:hypothetical protein